MRRALSWVYDDGNVDWPRLLLAGMTLTIVLAVGYFAVTSGAAFGPFNPTWEGTSDLRGELDSDAGTEVTFATETSRYEQATPTETVAFVLAPDDSYSSADAARVREFVADGGTLVVLENFGTAGNRLLADVGAEARVDGQLVRDEETHDVAPTMPIATTVSENHTLTDGVEQLTLNYGSAVDPNGATTLVATSEFAYLTENETVELDDDTELAAWPVATVEAVGNGSVVVVSDPSIAINIMLDRPDNARFLENLARQGETIVFDLSHTSSLPPLTRAVLAIRGSALLQLLVGWSLIAGVAVVSRRRLGTLVKRRLERHSSGATDSRVPISLGQPEPRGDQPLSTMDEESLAAYLRRQHPEWDEQRVRRVITALKPDDTKEEDERYS